MPLKLGGSSGLRTLSCPTHTHSEQLGLHLHGLLRGVGGSLGPASFGFPKYMYTGKLKPDLHGLPLKVRGSLSLWEWVFTSNKTLTTSQQNHEAMKTSQKLAACCTL